MSIFLIIPAGGSGSRYSKKKSKLKEIINKKSILEHTISSFIQIKEIKKIIISYPKEEIDWYKSLCSKYENIIIVQGGKTRPESVFNAFSKIPTTECSHVMIHDAARPNVSINLINKMIAKSNYEKAIIPGLKVTDTLKEIENNIVKQTINREKFITVQTPQLFAYSVLSKSYTIVKDITKFTDEGSLVEASKQSVYVIEGEKTNIKITHPTDLSLLKILLKSN